MSKKINMSAKPDTKKSADDWVSSRQSAPPPPMPTKRLTIDVPLDLHGQIKVRCAKEGLKMADTIREILREKFGGVA